MNSSNFIFLKNIDFEIYKDVLFIEKNYKKEPKSTIGLARSILERYLKYLLKNNGIESYKFQNILSNNKILQELNISNEALEKKELIRKSGNKALHSETNFTKEEALEILKCLFFIFKELSHCPHVEFNENYIKSEDKINSSNKIKTMFIVLTLFIFGFVFFFYNKFQITKTTDEKLIEIIEKNYENSFKDPSSTDINSYYFDINFDTSPYTVIKKEESNNPYWLKNLDWLKWKKTKSNNMYIGNYKIKNMTPLLFTRVLGWRGLIYSIYLIHESDNINDVIDFYSKKDVETIEGILDDTYEKIYPLNSDIFSFKNIFKYENQYYSLSRKESKELTSFVVYRLDATPKKIIYEKALPSFKYSPTLTLDERVVYFTSELAKLDKKMANLYSKAKKSLTGIDETNLINNQRKFLKERKLLGANINKIMDIYILRIKKIQFELKKELEKELGSFDSKIDILKSLKGTWEAKKYIGINQNIEYVNSNVDKKIKYDYPYIHLGDINSFENPEKYKIISSKSINSFKLIDEYDKQCFNEHSKHFKTKLPYLPYYVLIICKNIKNNEIIKFAYTYDSNGNQNLFLGMMKDGDNFFLDYGISYINSLNIEFINSGINFKRIDN